MDDYPDVAPFQMFSTDVNSHFVSYGCWEMMGGTVNYQWLMINGRQNTMSDAEVSQIKSEIA